MSKLDELRFKEFKVLDAGHVTLVDCMGDDHDIAQAARTSYGQGTRSVSDDRTLIRYLMRNSHTSPLEMAELKFHFRMPQLVWWQMVRHRTASANVESGRYSEMSEDMMATPPDGWRAQSTTNKQGSGGFVTEWPDPMPFEGLDCTPGEFLSAEEASLQRHARRVYADRLKCGVAREQARLDLPMSVYINVVWKIDLHNLLHFLRLRMDGHAQREICEYANIIGHEIVAPLFPSAWEAFVDYRLSAMSLSRLEIEAIQLGAMLEENHRTPDRLLAGFSNKRERDECRAKLVRLGLID